MCPSPTVMGGLWCPYPPHPYRPQGCRGRGGGGGAAVVLSGLPPAIPEGLLVPCFEDRRRSGGGPVLSWQSLAEGAHSLFRSLQVRGLVEGAA